MNRALSRLTRLADNALDLEAVLNNTIRALFITAVAHGQEYYGEKPTIGRVRLDALDGKPGIATLHYIPSHKFKDKFGSLPIANINLRERTYTPRWGNDYREDYWQVPGVLMVDTENVLEYLGLRKVEKE